MAMGARIKELRGSMEQATLCAKIPGLTQQNLSNMEKRDSKTSEFAPAIADEFGVSLRWLLTGEGSKTPEWPFKRVPHERIAALPAEELLVIEGALMMALHQLQPHKKGELPPGVVVIPERRSSAGRRVSGGLKSIRNGSHQARREADKKSNKG
jgi:hypothetical protein